MYGTQGAVPAGTYIYGDYCTGEIFAWNGATQTLLLDTAVNISSFGEDEQTGKPKKRQGTMTVAGKTFTVTQTK